MACGIDPDFDRRFGKRLCGIDEAGRGPWAGPVVAAAVIWREGAVIPDGLDDSKNLKPKQRHTLFDAICEQSHFAFGAASVEEIDRLNVLKATLCAMQRAYDGLKEGYRQTIGLALIDGNQPPRLPCATMPVVGGDGQSASIAAASILAKVTRDRLMSELGGEFPLYGFERHAGYGTRQHQEALLAHGALAHHRRSFAPIRNLLEHGVLWLEESG